MFAFWKSLDKPYQSLPDPRQLKPLIMWYQCHITSSSHPVCIVLTNSPDLSTPTSLLKSLLPEPCSPQSKETCMNPPRESLLLRVILLQLASKLCSSTPRLDSPWKQEWDKDLRVNDFSGMSREEKASQWRE